VLVAVVLAALLAVVLAVVVAGALVAGAETVRVAVAALAEVFFGAGLFAGLLAELFAAFFAGAAFEGADFDAAGFDVVARLADPPVDFAVDLTGAFEGAPVVDRPVTLAVTRFAAAAAAAVLPAIVRGVVRAIERGPLLSLRKTETCGRCHTVRRGYAACAPETTARAAIFQLSRPARTDGRSRRGQGGEGSGGKPR
jgi:hypothetical protein